MEKINDVLHPGKIREGDAKYIGFSSALIEIPEELIMMDKRNPFREIDGTQTRGDTVNIITMLALKAVVVSAALGASAAAKGSPSSLRGKN